MGLKKNLAVIGALLLVLAMGCTQSQNAGNAGGNPSGGTGGTGGNAGGTASPPVKEFSIVAQKFSFTPSTITVKKGDKVVIHLSSADVIHGFSLLDFGISKQVDPQNPITFEFVADKIGTFQFKCSVVCGEGHLGMKGALIVEEK